VSIWESKKHIYSVSVTIYKCVHDAACHKIFFLNIPKDLSFGKELHAVGFEVFMDVIFKIVVFWVVTPSSLVSGCRRFGAKRRLHLQG
jgi:hypothetical protein